MMAMPLFSEGAFATPVMLARGEASTIERWFVGGDQQAGGFARRKRAGRR